MNIGTFETGPYLHWTEHARDSKAHAALQAAAAHQQRWAELDPADAECWITLEQYAAAVHQAASWSCCIRVEAPLRARELAPCSAPIPDEFTRERWAVWYGSPDFHRESAAAARSRRTKRCLAAWRRTQEHRLLSEVLPQAGPELPRCAELIANELVPPTQPIAREFAFSAAWTALEKRVHEVCGRGAILSRMVVKALRRRRYEDTRPVWSWQTAYAAHASQIQAAIDLACSELGGIGIHSIRVARVGQSRSTKRYTRDRQANRHAGNFDRIISVGRTRYRIGFSFTTV